MFPWTVVIATIGFPGHSDSINEKSPDPHYLNALPEHHDGIEAGYVEAIRKDPYQAQVFCQFSQFLMHRVRLGTKPYFYLTQAAQLGDQCHSLGGGPLAQWGRALTQEAHWLLGTPPAPTPAISNPPSMVLGWQAKQNLEKNPALAKHLALRALEGWKKGVGDDSGEASLSLATALEKSTDGLALAQELSKAAQTYNSAYLWNRAGIAYEKMKDFQRSSQSFQKAMDLGNTLEAPLNLGLVLATHMGQPLKGLAVFSQVEAWVHTNGGGTTTRALILSYKSLARIPHLKKEEDKKDFQKDAGHCLELVGHNLRFSEVFLKTIEKAGHLPLMEESLLKVSQKFPGVALYRTFLGHVAKTNGNLSKAQEHYGVAQSLNHDLPRQTTD